MPQLFSGRHVGLDPKKLFRLFKEAEEGRFVHRLMAIHDTDALLRFLEVVELKSEEEGGGVVLNPSSVQSNLAFKSVPTGVFANNLEGLSLHWSQEEITEIHDFLFEPRTIDLREKLLVEVKKKQELLLLNSNPIARLQALWWTTNCHPAQEEQWDEHDFWEV